MDDFEKMTANLQQLNEAIHANTETLDMLVSNLSKARTAIKSCTTHELVGSPEKLREHVLVIVPLLSKEAGQMLVNNLNNLLKDNCEFTIEEIAKHNTKDDCWIIVDTFVYDLSTFVMDHPGKIDYESLRHSFLALFLTFR
jgi:cytochrome b involved in lipid metabolism